MKVHKSTWLDIKSGSPDDIIEAISDSLIPTRAVATDVRFNYEGWANNVIMDSEHALTKQMRFEWTDDE